MRLGCRQFLHKMRCTLDLWRITFADLIVRTSYQVGKTPLMPLFAASLGASEFMVGAIVSVSIMTGLVLKPMFGWLSDRWGRRFWLLMGVALFSGTPFLYQLIETPEQLFLLTINSWVSYGNFWTGYTGVGSRDG